MYTINYLLMLCNTFILFFYIKVAPMLATSLLDQLFCTIVNLFTCTDLVE